MLLRCSFGWRSIEKVSVRSSAQIEIEGPVMQSVVMTVQEYMQQSQAIARERRSATPQE